MREIVDSQRVRAFLKALGDELASPTTVYLTGGASAVLEGWRDSTIDLDLKFVPDSEVFNVLSALKERLRINVELASPDLFLPPVPGWEDRSPLIERMGNVVARHFDFTSQALCKIERGFQRDHHDVLAMVRYGRVDPQKLLSFARQIAPGLIRYPAVDPEAFLQAVASFTASLKA